MKVTVTDSRTGAKKTMSARYAKILTGIGRAQYMTRDMAAVPVVPVSPEKSPEPTAAPTLAPVSADSMLVQPKPAKPGKDGDESERRGRSGKGNAK